MFRKCSHMLVKIYSNNVIAKSLTNNFVKIKLDTGNNRKNRRNQSCVSLVIRLQKIGVQEICFAFQAKNSTPSLYPHTFYFFFFLFFSFLLSSFFILLVFSFFSFAPPLLFFHLFSLSRYGIHFGEGPRP